MSGMSESVINDTLFVNGEHLSKYGYVAVPRMQRETVCHILLLVDFRYYMNYRLTQLLRLFYAVKVKTDCFIRNLATLGDLTTGLAVVLLYGRLQALILHDTCPAPQTDRSPDLKFWNQCLALSQLYPKTDASSDKPTLKTWYRQPRTSFCDTTLFHRRCSSYNCCVCATYFH